MSDFPTHPDQVSAAWLNAVRDGQETAFPGSIEHVSWEPIGTGQVGDSVRFHLKHADSATSTMAAKFPAANKESRTTAAMLGLYAKEVRFYQSVAPKLTVRTPKVFHAAVKEDGSEFILLFEDLGPAEIGNQLTGCNLEQARAAIKQAAALHSSSWNKPDIVGHDWLHPPEQVTQQVNAMYPHANTVFCERYSEELDPEYLALCDALVESPFLRGVGPKAPQCVVHGDFRLDNMLFDVRGGAEPIAILDWQTVVAGRAMNDIGYFMGCGLGDTLRRAHEDELLALYCDEMEAGGVKLTREEIWNEYRKGALSGLTTAVFSAAFVERTERGDANFLSMARGACALALEHNALKSLEELS